MSAWQQEQLGRIAASDDLHISPFRQGGSTYGTPTWIWPTSKRWPGQRTHCAKLIVVLRDLRLATCGQAQVARFR
jgi:hypothetical protein